MTSSITRSSRSSVKKVTAPTINPMKSKASSTPNKKKKQIQRSIKKDADLENRSYQQYQQQHQQELYVI